MFGKYFLKQYLEEKKKKTPFITKNCFYLFFYDYFKKIIMQTCVEWIF